MKKLATLLLAAGMVVASTAPASAADVKLDGFYRYTFETQSKGFQGDNLDAAKQRMRLGLTIAASENLSGYTQFQLGTKDFGVQAKHGDRDVQTRQMYIDWKVPAAPVKVRMGRAQFGLPADAFGGNTVMGASWGPRDGVTVTAKATDWLDVTALWVRAAYVANDNDVDKADKADVFGLAANLKFDGFSVAPWFAYSAIDPSVATVDGTEITWTGLSGIAGLNNTNDFNFFDRAFGSNSYYFGATATLTAFDPFKLVVSAAYGNREYTGAGSDIADDRKGWNVQAKASYKLGFGTPIVAGWYATGDDADEDMAQAGWMPTISGYTTPTATFHDGGTSLGGGVCNSSISGTWGLQAGVEGMSFLSGLSHTATVTYIQGTNHTEKAQAVGAIGGLTDGIADINGYTYLSTSDSIVELALTSDYAIYKNLIATLELAYLINDFDNSADMVAARGEADKDDWRASLTFTYKF